MIAVKLFNDKNPTQGVVTEVDEYGIICRKENGDIIGIACLDGSVEIEILEEHRPVKKIEGEWFFTN